MEFETKRLLLPLSILLLTVVLFGSANTALASETGDTRLNKLEREVQLLRRQIDELRRIIDTQQLQREKVRLPVSSKVSLDDDPVLGSRKAKVAMIEFSDYECPFCRRFHSGTFDQIKRKYIDSGKIKFVYRDFPLGFHENAKGASIAANCAGEQGEYWAMLEKLFSKSRQLKKSFYVSTAKAMKLNLKKFKTCLKDPQQAAEVDNDLADGQKLRVTGTPTFFIGKVDGNNIVSVKRIVGAQPFGAFTQVIDGVLKKTLK